jgi:hypothetical protein
MSKALFGDLLVWVVSQHTSVGLACKSLGLAFSARTVACTWHLCCSVPNVLNMCNNTSPIYRKASPAECFNGQTNGLCVLVKHVVFWYTSCCQSSSRSISDPSSATAGSESTAGPSVCPSSIVSTFDCTGSAATDATSSRVGGLVVASV